MSRSTRDVHRESQLLSLDENRKVQELLGQKLISKSTAVVQLYTSQGCIFIKSLQIVNLTSFFAWM